MAFWWGENTLESRFPVLYSHFIGPKACIAAFLLCIEDHRLTSLSAVMHTEIGNLRDELGKISPSSKVSDRRIMHPSSASFMAHMV